MLFVALIELVVLIALSYWARWLLRRNTPWRRQILATNVGTVVAAGVFLLVAITGLIKTFGAAANVDPSRKATMLAEGISEAMSCAALSMAAILAGAIALGVIHLMVRRLERGKAP